MVERPSRPPYKKNSDRRAASRKPSSRKPTDRRATDRDLPRPTQDGVRRDKKLSARDENRRIRKFAEPEIPIEVTGKELEKRDAFALGTLAPENCEAVARHLVCIRLFLESDPERAYWHGQSAVFRAGRIGIVRERAGIAALNFGKYEMAQKELRAAIRISGSQSALPYLAHTELALGNPRKALEIAGSIDPKELTQSERVELRLAAAGARRALGQDEAAVVTLTCPELTLTDASWAAKLQEAYIEALIAAGRSNEAEVFAAKYRKSESSR
ncbi:MAG: RagB/SusD family nutrient uptake outer membrane protein [Actinobacteria bacterium]|nr:RagB/SusD family nutrient uptake outer membrane protein [Actinomycetota bacterium]